MLGELTSYPHVHGRFLTHGRRIPLSDSLWHCVGGVRAGRNHNVFERDVTQSEQAIINARVAAQRQMFAEYEKRETNRKVRERDSSPF
jgi:hypothetical protein